jgi:hypothetical protein
MRTAQETTDAYFLEMRWRCLSLAADLDRIHRSENGPATLSSDPRLHKLQQALRLLTEAASSPNRAEKVQDIFSDHTPPPPYGRKSST